MKNDLDRMISLEKQANHSHPQEAEILTTVLKWINAGAISKFASDVDIIKSLPDVISVMDQAITEATAHTGE